MILNIVVFKLSSEKTRKVKVQLSLSEDILKSIDKDAHDGFLSRSAWVSKAALKMLEKRKSDRIDDIVRGK